MNKILQKIGWKNLRSDWDIKEILADVTTITALVIVVTLLVHI